MRTLVLLGFIVGTAGAQTLSSKGIELTLDPAAGYGISSLRSSPNGLQFAATAAKAGLYRITLSRPGAAPRDITAKGAKVARSEVTRAGFTLVFEHPAERIRVTCQGRTDASRVAFRIRIDNQGPDGVRSVFYPQWIAPAEISSGGKADRILFPFLDGQEFVEPAVHFRPGQSFRAPYPGQAALQMLAFHNGREGALIMARDGEGWVKHLRLLRTREGFDFTIEHNPGEAPGRTLDLPYETTLELFRGGWQTAADIYRAWGVKQKWARQTLRGRLPYYLDAGLPLVTFAMRGDPYSAEWSMYFPPSNRLINPDFLPRKIPGLMNAYARFFGSKVIANPFGWEKHAPWIAGDYFPPFVGEEAWSKMADGVRAGGHPLFMLLSGARWGVNMDDAGYHNYETFLRDIAPRAAAYSPDGKPGEEHPPWASSVQLCVGTPFVQQHLLEVFLGCVKRGASMVQYDQNHGGMAFVCYNRNHPHPWGYGRWMVERTEQLFARIIAEGRKLDPNFQLAIEEPCEYFIPYWGAYMGRPYEFFGTGSDPGSYRVAVPLFLYVYHEYLLGYGGSNEIDIAHPYAEAIKVARKFVNGTLLEVDPGKPAYRLDMEPFPTAEMELAKSCLSQLQGPGRRYLIYGRMLPDPPMPDVRRERIRMWRDPRDPRLPSQLPTVDVPVVLASAWEADGKTAWALANWQTTSQTVTAGGRRVTVPAMSALVVEVK